MANKGTFLASISSNNKLDDTFGDYITSPNGQFMAIMQQDGNFVLYRGTAPNEANMIWATNTREHTDTDQFGHSVGYPNYLTM